MFQRLPLLIIIFNCYVITFAQQNNSTQILFPGNHSDNVNPDTHLTIRFNTKPLVGNAGKIRIYNAANNKLVDSLDVGIPAGPKEKDTSRIAYTPTPYEYKAGHFTNANTKPGTPSGTALPNSSNYQLTIIGGFTDAFHFYPIIIHDSTATIYPHNNLLEYNKTYYVTIEPQVFNVPNNGFKGINKTGWQFTTKKSAPPKEKKLLIVSTDGKTDFNTVQGAIDFVPENNQTPVTIFIKKGFYEEIVYFRKKSNVSFIGEDREKTVIYYNNDEPFNPHPANVATNELPGTFPSRRGTFMVDNCDDISIVNLSIKNPSNRQAEGLLMTGQHNVLYKVNVRGGGDALQVNGSVYLKQCKIEGGGDMILGRGATFFDHCELYSQYAFMWIRNTEANHGNVFVDCTIKGTGKEPTVIAREPINKDKTYPFSEAVLINCKLENISKEGWGPIDGETKNIHYWEYNSTNLNDGKPIDISQRHPVSKQLTMEKDAKIIADYSNPAFVLSGWQPDMEEIRQKIIKAVF